MSHHERFIRRAIELSVLAKDHGNHPFGALLVNDDNEIILEAENTVYTEHDVTRHAELNLVSKASRTLDPEVIQQSTLYTSTEPCAMCSGSIFWYVQFFCVFLIP
jgi:tRNA(Arg) A34 adenosine deaminase TadA